MPKALDGKPQSRLNNNVAEGGGDAPSHPPPPPPPPFTSPPVSTTGTLLASGPPPPPPLPPQVYANGMVIASAPPPPPPPSIADALRATVLPPPPPPPPLGVKTDTASRSTTKQIHWGKIADPKNEDSAWHAGGVAVDGAELRRLFQVKQRKPLGAPTVQKGNTFVLSAQRAKNIGICLKGLGKGGSTAGIVHLVDTLGTGHDGASLLEIVALLPQLLPTAAERSAFEKMKGTELTAVESVVMELGRVPQIAEKIRCLTHITHFILALKECEGQIGGLHAAVSSAVRSSRLATALCTAVAAGNILNQDKPWGNAVAVSPDSLAKLADVRSTDGANWTLLQMVYDTLDADDGVRFFSYLQGETCKLNSDALRCSLQDVQSTLKSLFEQVKWMHAIEWEDAAYSTTLHSLFLQSPWVKRLEQSNYEFKRLLHAVDGFLVRFAWKAYHLDDSLQALCGFKDALLALHAQRVTKEEGTRGGKDSAPQTDVLLKWALGEVHIPAAEVGFVPIGSFVRVAKGEGQKTIGVKRPREE